MSYNIAAFGAFDINSLGDMLFPKALEIELRKRLVINNIIFFSPTSAQSAYSSDYKIFPYERFEELHREYSFDAVIVGGGELLHYDAINFKDIHGETISYQNGRIWRYPVEMGKKHGLRVLFNSVGMPHDITDKDKELLAGLAYISFRDRYSFYRFYGRRDVSGNNMVPDSLWNLDEYFPAITARENSLCAHRTIGLEQDSRYVAFQMGTLDNWEDIYKCVLDYCRKNNLKLVAFAINWCHDDKVVIERLSMANESDCFIINRILQVEEIMSIIAGADTLVCTSFHGTLLGCLSKVRTLVYNMYSDFVSKMDGLADWLGKRDLLIDNIEQLKAALWYAPNYSPELPLTKIKGRLMAHFDHMAHVISGTVESSGHDAIRPAVHPLNFDRSFFEWNRHDGALAWRTVISISATDAYKIEEHIEHNGPLLWAFKSLAFITIHVDSPNMASGDVDGHGRCYDRYIQFNIADAGEDVLICYHKTVKEQDEDFSELLRRYWNKAAHVRLLEEKERYYLENGKKLASLSSNNLALTKENIVLKEFEKKAAELLSENQALAKENNALKEINILELEANAKLKRNMDSLEEENLQLRDAMSQHQSVTEGMDETIANLRQTILNKEGHIQLLLETEREYEREKRSRTYRMALAFRRISVFLLPVDSKRRFFCKLLAKAARHPIRMARMVNPRRIRNCFTILKTEGTGSASSHLRLVEEFERSGSVDGAMEKLDVTQVESGGEPSHALEDYAPLHFELPEDPLVTIVIPVYNQFDYTYHCLESILKHSGDISYEVLLADDCSTDLTREIGKAISGIRIVRNQENLRFLLNCNNAAAQARGRYILFLNNDTQVQADWLRPLVELMEGDPTVGLTGSKLVYSDGHLQEAGGIFWNDASAWNYGHMQNPEDPEYNYVKEVDYISGASLMIRRSLWEEIGGFDQRYAPAYYEDPDLAFEVRRCGYRVVYQPLSVVVHFEGISNGTDVSAGQKAYQTVNQEKFYEKWKDVLEKEHFPNGEDVFLAKDRSRNKKHILVVDHYVPHYDKDAGGKCTYMYLLLFVRMGFKVTFIGDNFYKHEPYTTDLNQHGIEVLYGNYYFNNWKEWLADNLHYFDYVYLQRPHISIKYIDLVKRHGRAKVFYFAHDLHHIREYREYMLTHDEERLKSSERWKKIEHELFEKADVGHVVGSYEQGIMQEAFPGKPIRNIPLYIYEDMPTGVNKDFRERHDLLYVGGFGHPPNIDAVLWFGKEVFPKILERHPDMRWHVVGGKVPVEIQDMASDNVIIEGFLPDEGLHALYRECRMAVVPLRVGAGVKGKVVEAAYFQIPLVTTTIGAEGLDAGMGNMVVEDDADRMADIICGLYSDYDRLKEMSDAGIEFISEYFTEQEAERVLKLDL